MEAPSPATNKADGIGVGRTAVEAEGEALPIPRLRQALDDLFIPCPARYWLDFLGSMLCFYGGFAIVAAARLAIPLKLLAFAVSALGLYGRSPESLEMGLPKSCGECEITHIGGAQTIR